MITDKQNSFYFLSLWYDLVFLGGGFLHHTKINLFFWEFLGSLQELVSRQETALQEKEQQVRHLEEKERQLQLEVCLLSRDLSSSCISFLILITQLDCPKVCQSWHKSAFK